MKEQEKKAPKREYSNMGYRSKWRSLSSRRRITGHEHGDLPTSYKL